MSKIYHFNTKLIIIDKMHKVDKYDSAQGLILRRLRAPVQVMYDAHEIWLYNRHTRRFEMYKNNKNGIGTLLEKFFADKGIKLKCDAADMTAKAIGYRFEESKDEFLFKLKF